MSGGHQQSGGPMDASQLHAQIGMPAGSGVRYVSEASSKDRLKGALFKALSVFALRDINLTKLESRPMRGRPWEYLFYVEVDAPRSDLGCARALTHLAEFARWTRVLGTYKGAERRQAA